jgi:hypothetical protein
MMNLNKESFPSSLQEMEFWISFDLEGKKNASSSSASADDSNDEEDDNSEGEEEKEEVSRGKKVSFLGKRKGVTTNKEKKKKALSSPLIRLASYSFYQKLFSKNWILLLSLSFWNIKSHKLILQHLSLFSILKELSNPLLLADYFTECYRYGGILAILSLEMLFHLIITYNLDYPHFFYSLYSLGNLLIFQSKYSHKFTSLLAICLKSTNLSENMIFSFLKRLSSIALHCNCNRTIYCIYEIIWILKQYKNCQKLIHRKKIPMITEKEKTERDEDSMKEIIKKKGEEFIIELEDENDLMKNNAVTSSLYELELLENHYLYEKIGKIVTSIRNPEITSINAIPIEMSQYTNISYHSIIEEEFENMKKNYYKSCAFTYKKPITLF